MATRGFEFAYMIDGSNATPKAIDLVLGQTTDYLEGDAVLIQSDGYADKVTNTTTEVTGIMAEYVTGATAGTTEGKAWLVTREQVWKCSMDATTTSFYVGYTKTVDTVDANTVSASDSTGGALILMDKAELDDEGNVLAYVVFSDTTFGNA